MSADSWLVSALDISVATAIEGNDAVASTLAPPEVDSKNGIISFWHSNCGPHQRDFAAGLKRAIHKKAGNSRAHKIQTCSRFSRLGCRKVDL